MSGEFSWACVIQHSKAKFWRSNSQRLWWINDSGSRDWTCAVSTRLSFLLFPCFTYLFLVIKHCRSHKYKCKSCGKNNKRVLLKAFSFEEQSSFSKRMSADAAERTNVCRLDLSLLPRRTRSRPLAALLPQSACQSTDKKARAHPAACQSWC